MNSNILKSKIKWDLLRLSSEKLEETRKFIECLIDEDEKGEIIKLKGIWSNLGFEKINNLEEQIRAIRMDSEKLLDERINRWNI